MNWCCGVVKRGCIFIYGKVLLGKEATWHVVLQKLFWLKKYEAFFLETEPTINLLNALTNSTAPTIPREFHAPKYHSIMSSNSNGRKCPAPVTFSRGSSRARKQTIFFLHPMLLNLNVELLNLTVDRLKWFICCNRIFISMSVPKQICRYFELNSNVVLLLYLQFLICKSNVYNFTVQHLGELHCFAPMRWRHLLKMDPTYGGVTIKKIKFKLVKKTRDIKIWNSFPFFIWLLGLW